jgi:Domain of unknown function (DUF5615)
MNLYLDDDSARPLLTKLLRSAAHQVTLPAGVGLGGAADPKHFLHAVQHARIALTGNHVDFEILHLIVQTTGGRHPGIFVVRSDNDRSRDMKDRDIVRAIARLEAAGVPIENELHVLNHWR